MHSILCSCVKEHLTYCSAISFAVKSLNTVGPVIHDEAVCAGQETWGSTAQGPGRHLCSDVARGSNTAHCLAGAILVKPTHYSWLSSVQLVPFTMQATSAGVFWRCPRSANICHTFPAILTVAALMCLKVTIHLVNQCTSLNFKHCSMLGPICPPFNVQYALGPSQSDFAQVSFAVYSLSRTLHGLTLSQMLHKQKYVQFTVCTFSILG